MTREINILCAVEITDRRYFQRILNDMKCRIRENISLSGVEAIW